MSTILQRLAQRGAATAAATGMAPLQLRPRSRYEAGSTGIETTELAAAPPSAPHALAVRPTLSTGTEARGSPAMGTEFHEGRTAMLSSPHLPLAEPGDVWEETDYRSPPPPAARRDALGDPRRSTLMPEVQQSLPVAGSEAEPGGRHEPTVGRHGSLPFEPAQPRIETLERRIHGGAPSAADTLKATDAPTAEPPPTLSIGRLEVQFVQPPARSAPAAPARRGAGGFADYARIRRGSPR
jgi:hypothetical protein